MQMCSKSWMRLEVRITILNVVALKDFDPMRATCALLESEYLDSDDQETFQKLDEEGNYVRRESKVFNEVKECSRLQRERHNDVI